MNPKTFLGDATFDSAEIYKYLLEDTSIEKAYIPLNGRMTLPEADCPLNENGIPCCPKDASLPMKQIPFTLRAPYHEVCVSQNEMGI